MALLDSELARIKAELGYSLLSNGAEPYISIVAIFEQVIQPFLLDGADTTSTTVVAASSAGTQVSLTLASATGFAARASVIVDVDDRQEIVTIQSLSGTTAVVLLKKEHSGTYPVTVEGGVSIVRDVLRRIAAVKTELLDNYGAGALKQVDEISFYEAKQETHFGILGDNLTYWREQLAAHLGIPNMWAVRQGAQSSLSVY